MDLMAATGELFACEGYFLRSGGAKGADKAFEAGCDAGSGSKEIFYANDAKGDSAAFDLAARFHPNWGACSPYAKFLHARNGYIILGKDLDTPVDEIVCWTPNASGSGGTGQALRIAKEYEIPVWDLADEAILWNLIDLLVPLYEKHITT